MISGPLFPLIYTQRDLDDAIMRAYTAGKEFMKGREYSEGWVEGAKAAFDSLGERRDERFMVLMYQKPLSPFEMAEKKGEKNG